MFSKKSGPTRLKMSLLVGPWLAKQMYQVSLATLGEEPGLLAQTPEWSWAFWGAALSRRRQHQQLCLFVSPWQSLRQTRFLSCGTQMLPLRSACLLEQHSLGGKKKKRKKKSRACPCEPLFSLLLVIPIISSVPNPFFLCFLLPVSMITWLSSEV